MGEGRITVWCLLGNKAGDNTQVRALAAALGWPCIEQRIHARPWELWTHLLPEPGLAGIDRARALSMVEPLVRETVDNVFRLGTARALTGPLARGDDGVVAHHLDALAAALADGVAGMAQRAPVDGGLASLSGLGQMTIDRNVRRDFAVAQSLEEGLDIE